MKTLMKGKKSKKGKNSLRKKEIIIFRMLEHIRVVFFKLYFLKNTNFSV